MCRQNNKDLRNNFKNLHFMYYKKWINKNWKSIYPDNLSWLWFFLLGKSVKRQAGLWEEPKVVSKMRPFGLTKKLQYINHLKGLNRVTHGSVNNQSCSPNMILIKIFFFRLMTVWCILFFSVSYCTHTTDGEWCQILLPSTSHWLIM